MILSAISYSRNSRSMMKGSKCSRGRPILSASSSRMRFCSSMCHDPRSQKTVRPRSDALESVEVANPDRLLIADGEPSWFLAHRSKSRITALLRNGSVDGNERPMALRRALTLRRVLTISLGSPTRLRRYGRNHTFENPCSIQLACLIHHMEWVRAEDCYV